MSAHRGSANKRRVASARGDEHALLAPAVVNVFEVLDVGLTLWRPIGWLELCERPLSRDLQGFELEHGVENERIAYNDRCIARARRERRSVIAEHAGATDLFVPVVIDGRAEAVLATGPLHVAHPTAQDLLRRWRNLTGRQGHPSDPEFSHYLSSVLSTLVLDGARLAKFQTLVECVARLMGRDGSALELFARIDRLRNELMGARVAQHMWDVARLMVEEGTTRVWASPVVASRLAPLGVARVPEHVAVGIFVDRQRDSDPVDQAIRCQAFQRACAELAHAEKNAVSGQIGGHGVTFLCAGRGSRARTERYLVELAERAASVARRRFGMDLHVGFSAASADLSEQYQAALAAAELALVRGVRSLAAENSARAVAPLGPLRQQLARSVDEDPRSLPARFDRYLEAVALRSGDRLEVAKAHAEAGFERIAEVCRERGVLEPKTWTALESGLERGIAEAGTTSELFAVYRRAVADIADAVAEPRAARATRSVRLADEYMRKHYARPITLAEAAKIAGFSSRYFSLLFRDTHGITFERYLLRLRVERAQQLLSSSSLSLERIARLTGFSGRNYFGRAFKRATGETPITYRQRVRRTRGRPERRVV